MKMPSRMGIIGMTVALLLLSLSVGCDNGDETSISSTPSPTDTIKTEPRKMTIGLFTDITGPAARPMAVMTMAIEDMLDYYNEQNLIPGVELDVISYDGQYDPSRDIPGYELLKEKDVDFMASVFAGTGETLKSRLNEDQMMLFLIGASREAVEPPGYVLGVGQTFWEYHSYTLLKWIAENDPDFPTGRPARIGGAFWAEPAGEGILAGAEEYTEAHPDQYEWVGGYTTNFSFVWGPEVEALKDCDYVFPPHMMDRFVIEYRNSGYTAKFIGTDLHLALLGMVYDADLWDDLDGMIVVRTNRWWNEEGELIDLTKKLLYENHPDTAEQIMRDGNGYLGTQQILVMLELIADAAEAVGTENLNSQAVFDAAKSFSLTIDGIELNSFNETKRTSLNYFKVYEARVAEEDLFSLSPEWIPVVREP